MVKTLNKRTAPTLLPIGVTFGRLTATDEYHMRKRPDGRNRCYQKFLCLCGATTFLVPYSVKNGNTSSCGCLHTEQVQKIMTTHGLSKTSAYRVRLNKARRAQKRATSYTGIVEKVSSAVLDQILQENNNTCWICQVNLEIVQWDHVIPLSKGGLHNRNNLKPSCKECNSRKGSINPFTNEIKDKIANDVRALRASRASAPHGQRGGATAQCQE